MTLIENYRGFVVALASGQLDQLPRFVDPEHYTEACVGLTGWTVGLDVALVNFQYGIASAFPDLASEELEVVEGEDHIVIRSRTRGTHRAPFLGLTETHRHVVWDSLDMYRSGEDGRITWRFLLCDWEGVRNQILGQPAPSDTPSRYAVQAPPGHPLAAPHR